MVIGTSAGALISAYLVSNWHRGEDEAIEDGLRFWRDLQFGDVFAPLMAPAGAARFMRYVGEFLPARGRHAPSILHPEPLRQTLERLVDFEQLGENIREQRLALGVVATSAHANRSVVFHQGGIARHRDDPLRGIEYVATPRLGVEHMLASSAIPALFPSLRVTTPTQAAGWYYDGGPRLNTPIKPALWLGAKRVIVIGRADAQRWIDEHPTGLWQLDPLPAWSPTPSRDASVLDSPQRAHGTKRTGVSRRPTDPPRFQPPAGGHDNSYGLGFDCVSTSVFTQPQPGEFLSSTVGRKPPSGTGASVPGYSRARGQRPRLRLTHDRNARNGVVAPGPGGRRGLRARVRFQRTPDRGGGQQWRRSPIEVPAKQECEDVAVPDELHRQAKAVDVWTCMYRVNDGRRLWRGDCFSVSRRSATLVTGRDQLGLGDLGRCQVRMA